MSITMESHVFATRPCSLLLVARGPPLPKMLPALPGWWEKKTFGPKRGLHYDN